VRQVGNLKQVYTMMHGQKNIKPFSKITYAIRTNKMHNFYI